MNENTTTYVPTPEDFAFRPQVLSRWEQAEAVSGGKHDFAKRFFSGKLNILGLVILALLVLSAILIPLIGPDYNAQHLDATNLSPSGAHWFGTDTLGRDMFSRCFMGLRVSLIIAAVATLIDLFIGMNYGIISGYFGGTTDIIMQRVIDIIGSIPTLVVVTLLMLVLEPGMGAIILALMLTGWIEMSLIARSQVMRVKQMEYIQAARTLGAGHFHIITKDIMPNIIGKLVTQIMISIPEAVFLEAFLSFIGLGMPAGTCSLGTLLSDGFNNALLYPYKLIPAAVVMILLMCGSHLVSEGLKKSSGGMG